jgi:NAD(P)-dependent dehydrogenase (short-subunit alcohol dehydrogenase family)
LGLWCCESGRDQFHPIFSCQGKRHHITANAIIPGIIDMPANRQAMPNANFAEWVAPDAVAKTILFLASDAAQAITGAIVPVGG